jgi:SSS family solute:Na+ symporter
MTITFVLIVAVMIGMSILQPQTEESKKNHVEIDLHLFKVSPAFIAGSIIILGILTGLYATFW